MFLYLQPRSPRREYCGVHNSRKTGDIYPKSTAFSEKHPLKAATLPATLSYVLDVMESGTSFLE